MWRPSFPRHRQIVGAAASSGETAASMSSRPRSRGGRPPPRRGFSDRANGGGRVYPVTGDSHYRSVREANLRYGGENFSNQASYQPQRPPVSFGPRPSPPHPRNQNSQSFRHPRPYNQGQRSVRPKPPDYRVWEHSKTPTPPDAEKFIVVSYNILADYLASSHRKLYFHIPFSMMDWQWRKERLLFELGLWSPDIMCLQEVDKFQELGENLKLRGYTGIWKIRTGNAIDGCAIFWRTTRFKLLYEESIEFSKLGLRDNVAQLCVLELMNPNCSKSTAFQLTSSADSKKVIICNTHILYNPRRGEIKLGQVRRLLDRAHAISKDWNDAPVVLCGDFNCTPKSPLYNFISEQKLDLSAVDRDKVSGQSSAEIRAPRSENPKQGAMCANGSAQVLQQIDGNEVHVGLNASPQGMQKENYADKKVENITNTNNSSSPGESCSKLLSIIETITQCDSKENMQHDEGARESEQTVVDSPGCPYSVLADNSEKSSSYCHSKDRCQRDHKNDTLEISCSGVSSPKEIFSDVTKTNQSGENATSLSSLGLPEHSMNSIFIESESVNFGDHKANYHASKVQIDAESATTPHMKIYSTHLFSQSSSSSIPISSPEVPVCVTSHSFANDESGSSAVGCQVDFSGLSMGIDDKLGNLSLREVGETAVDSGNVVEDDRTFLAALHGTEDAFPEDLRQIMRSDVYQFPEGLSTNRDMDMPNDEAVEDKSPSSDSDVVDFMEKTAYDPALWTPADIATATGSEECTRLEHHLPLRSTYAEVEGCSGTRDLPSGEPLVTSYNRCFLGTVDYIWRSEGLQTVRVLAPIPKQVMLGTPGFPTKKWGSDHIALASELAFTKDSIKHD